MYVQKKQTLGELVCQRQTRSYLQGKDNSRVRHENHELYSLH